MFLSFNVEKKTVILNARVFYHYEDAPPDKILVDTTVQNVFEIEDLQKFIMDGNDLKFPQSLITTLVSLSISHTRALMTQRISGTVYQDNIMGIIDPEKLAQHFFPNMFNATDSKRKKELALLNLKAATENLKKSINKTTDTTKISKKTEVK